MTQGHSQQQKLVSTPNGFGSFGSCLLEVFKPHRPLGLICFSRVERQISVFPAVSTQKEEEILCFLLESEWRTDRNAVFVDAFRRLGVSTGEDGKWICGGLLAPDRSDGPVGAWAVLQNPDLSSDGPEPDLHAIHLLLEELIRTRQRMKKSHQAFEEVDHVRNLVTELGAMLPSTTHREQALVLLLEIALHRADAEVGAILRVDDTGCRPEVDLGLPFDVLNDMRLHPWDESPLERVMLTRQPVIVDSSSGSVAHVSRPHDVRVAGLAAIPLLVDQEVVGVLCLASGESGKIVSTRMPEALGAITGVVAVAVENNRLRVEASKTDCEAPSPVVTAPGAPGGSISVVKDSGSSHSAVESFQAAAELRSQLACVQLGLDGLLDSGAGDDRNRLETTMRRSLGALRRLCEDLELGSTSAGELRTDVLGTTFSLTEVIEQAVQQALDDRIEVAVESHQGKQAGDDRVCGDPDECRAVVVRLLADISRRCLKASSVFISVERLGDSVRARFEFDDDVAGYGTSRNFKVGLHTARQLLVRNRGALKFGRSSPGRSWSEAVLPASFRDSLGGVAS